MKTILKLVSILSLVLLTSCGANWSISTFNYDPIYEDENYVVISDDIKIDTLNEFQFRNKLRTDMGFRLDFARYALSQPVSFDWNNRLLGRSYNYGYNSYYWNRDQMWNDWAWGYTGWNSWGSPHRWSLFGYDRWGYNNWMGNVHYGWNSYYGWNGYYNDWDWRWRMNNYAWQNRYRSNTVYVNGRRGSIQTTINNSNRRTNNTVRTRTNNTTRTRTNNTVRINRSNNDTRTIRTNVRNSDVRPPIRTSTPNNYSTPPRVRPSQNTNTRSVRPTTTRKSGGTPRRQR
jgi:hypothetical protein